MRASRHKHIDELADPKTPEQRIAMQKHLLVTLINNRVYGIAPRERRAHQIEIEFFVAFKTGDSATVDKLFPECKRLNASHFDSEPTTTSTT